MHFFDRIAGWWLKRDEPPQQYQQPAPGTPQPATVIIRETPRRRISRGSLVGVGLVLLLAFFFARSAAHVTVAPQKPPEFPSFDVDKPGIRRTMASLASAQADAEKALKEQEEALRLRQQAASPFTPQPGQPYQPTYGQAPPAPQPTPVTDPIAERKKELAYKSLFASPVIPVRSTEEIGSQTPPPGTTAELSSTAKPSSGILTSTEAGKPEPSHNCLDLPPLYAICEGTIVAGRLQNRLVGEFSGPLNVMVSNDVFSRDRQRVLIPKGTVLLGTAAKTSSSYDSRLSVGFHRMILPDGTGRDLHNAVGLDLAGETALKDKTDHHLKSVIATTVALGGLAGFSQFGAGSAFTGGGIDSYRSGIAQQAGQTGQQLIGRSLNRPPTITIMEGHPVNVYLSEDLRLPEFTHGGQ